MPAETLKHITFGQTAITVRGHQAAFKKAFRTAHVGKHWIQSAPDVDSFIAGDYHVVARMKPAQRTPYENE